MAARARLFKRQTNTFKHKAVQFSTSALPICFRIVKALRAISCAAKLYFLHADDVWPRDRLQLRAIDLLDELAIVCARATSSSAPTASLRSAVADHSEAIMAHAA